MSPFNWPADGHGHSSEANHNFLDIMTTPPLSSSSPAISVDMMDMSPLPHKIPYSHQSDSDLESPTADLSNPKPKIYIPSPLQDSPIGSTHPNIPPE